MYNRVQSISVMRLAPAAAAGLISSLGLSAHFPLCSFQSATWHSLEQYHTALHFEHLLKAYLLHLLHLNPSISPSIVELEYRSASLFMSYFIAWSLEAQSHYLCLLARAYQSRFLSRFHQYWQMRVFRVGISCTTKGLFTGWEGTLISDSYYKARSITDRVGIWSSNISFMYFLS